MSGLTFLELVMSMPKTIVFNYKYFNIDVAYKLPVWIHYKTKLRSLKGKVYIKSCFTKTGLIRIGFGDVGIFDKCRSRTIWKNNGVVNFNGVTNIGHGSKIVIEKAGQLNFGANFTISAESQIICNKKISFGNDCLISWDVLIMDTDFHDIIDLKNEVLNFDKEICIGNHVWIGARVMIKKGVKIADNSIISAQSVVIKNLLDQNCIWGGNPVRLVKCDVQWSISNNCQTQTIFNNTINSITWKV